MRGVRQDKMLVLMLQHMDCFFLCSVTICAAPVTFSCGSTISHFQWRLNTFLFWSVRQTAMRRTCHACSVSADSLIHLSFVAKRSNDIAVPKAL